MQHQEFTPRLSADQKLAPTALTDDKAEIISSSISPNPSFPDVIDSEVYSPESLQDRRTVQGVAGTVGIYLGDSCADDGARRESDLAQDIMELMYEPSPSVNNAILDLVYVPPSNVGMDWAKRHQPNHPHTFVDSPKADTQQ